MGSRPGAKIREASDGVIVDGLERVEEADRLVFGERDLSLIGEHVSCPVGCGSPEEVAERFADRGGGSLVDGPLLVGESKFKSLSTHSPSVRTPYGTDKSQPAADSLTHLRVTGPGATAPGRGQRRSPGWCQARRKRLSSEIACSV